MSFHYSHRNFRIVAPSMAGVPLRTSEDPDEVVPGELDGMVAATSGRVTVMPMAEAAVIHVDLVVMEGDEQPSHLGGALTSVPLSTPAKLIQIQDDLGRVQHETTVPWALSRVWVEAVSLPDPQEHELWNYADFGETYRISVGRRLDGDEWITRSPHPFQLSLLAHFAGIASRPKRWLRPDWEGQA